MPLDHFDICVAGAGAVGLAITQKITAHPGLQKCSVVLLEKNRRFGQETSSRNSEVIHAGIYYPRSSLKARLCLAGREQLYRYCAQHDIPHRKTGKLILARQDQEDELRTLQRQACLNGVTDLTWLGRKDIPALEPEVDAAVALFSPSSGIIDSHAYMQSLLDRAESGGAIYSPLTEVTAIRPGTDGYVVSCDCQGTQYRFGCDRFINAAGLAAQATAEKIEGFPTAKIPALRMVKGSYFNLQGKSPFSHLIYPLPEKDLRGLGVHVTLDLSGQTRFGPDAEPVSHIDYDVDGNKEGAFRSAIGRYYPGIRERVLSPAYSGIRPKLDMTDSTEGFADFIIQAGDQYGFRGLVQLFGIESPGLTASLAIADDVITLLLAES